MADTHPHWCVRTDEDGRCRSYQGSFVVHVARRGQFFATREGARQFIAKDIATLSRREGVLIDWTGVQAVTGAFASEFAAWCLKADRRFGNLAMNDEVRETYVTAMRRLEGAASGSPGSREGADDVR